MIKEFSISMPHRHTVIYKDSDVSIQYEVELAQNGIIFYSKSPKLIWGSIDNIDSKSEIVISQLKRDFDNVIIDNN
jgi:hypothetical protein